MRIVDCEQNSAEWFWARTGRITASRMSDLMATLKRGGEAASRRDYRAQLIAERLTGKTEDRYLSKEMQFGIEQEPFARTAYEIEPKTWSTRQDSSSIHGWTSAAPARTD